MACIGSGHQLARTHYTVQSLYAPFSFTKKYIASPCPKGISYSQTFHKSLIKNCEPFGCAFGQRNQKPPQEGFLTKKYIASPCPKGSFYSIFCEKIVFYA